MKTKAFKKALAILLAVMLAVPYTGLASIVSYSEPAQASVTAGQLVAQNYDSLTDAEKAVLTSGLVTGATYTYTAPTDGDDLVSVNTDAKTITADSFTADSLVWTPESAAVVYSGGRETVALNGGAGAYSYAGGAFAVEVSYTTAIPVDAAVQAKLLNGPVRLANGLANVKAFADEWATFDVLGSNINVFVNLTNNLSNAATVNAINDLASEVAGSQDECLNILTLINDYSDNYSGNEAAYVIKNGNAFKDAALDVYAKIKTIAEDTQIESAIENLTNSANKRNAQRVINALKDTLANTRNAAEDSWAILDTALTPFIGLTDAQLTQLNALAANVAAGAEHTDAVKAGLSPAAAVVSKNVNQYNVSVTVRASVISASTVNSAEPTYLDSHTTVIKAYEGASAETVIAAIADSNIEADSIAAWGIDVSNFVRHATNLTGTITGNVSYYVDYLPKDVFVTYDFDAGLPTAVPYGYNLVLPVNADEEKVYDYTVNGASYNQGEIVHLTADAAITRTEGKAWDAQKINEIVAVNYDEVLTENEKNILNSVAVASDTVRFRTPGNKDGLVTVTRTRGAYRVDAADYASGTAGLSWQAVSGKAMLNGAQVAAFTFNNGVAEFTADDFDSVSVEYTLALTNITDTQIEAALNIPGDLASEAADQISALDTLYSSYDKLNQLDKKTVNQIQVGVKGSDMGEEAKTAANSIVNSCVDRTAGSLYLIGYLDGYHANGLAYYYRNDVAIRNQIEILYNNLNTIYNDPGLHNLLVDIGYEEYEAKIADIIAKLGAVKRDLTAPNAAINLSSPSVTELAEDLTALAGRSRSLTSNGSPLELTATLTAPAPGRAVVTINVTAVNSIGETVKTGTDTVIVSSENALTAADVAALDAALAALTASAGIDTDHYATTDTLGFAAGDTVAADVTVSLTYAPKTYTVTFKEGDSVTGTATFPFDVPTINLPACEEDGKAYVYTAAGTQYTVRGESKAVTFTEAQIDSNSYAVVTRTTVDITKSDLLELVDAINYGFASAGLVNGSGNLTASFIPMTDASDNISLLLRVSPDNFSKIDNGIVNMVEELTGSDFTHITLDGEYLREDNLFSAQAVVDAVLNSGISVDTVLGMISPNGDIIESTLSGYTVVGATGNTIAVGNKRINNTDVVGAVFYETDMNFATSSSDSGLDVKLYVSIEDFDQSASDLKTVRKLASKVRGYGNVVLHNGTVDVNVTLPEKAYQAYLAAALVMAETDLDSLNNVSINRLPDIVIDSLKEVLNDTTVTYATFKNTAEKLGFDLDFDEYEKYVNKGLKAGKNVINNTTFSNQTYGLNTYSTDGTYDLTSLLDKLNVKDSLRGMIKEKDTGVTANLSLAVNPRAQYEAIVIDTGATGVKNKAYFSRDILTDAANLKGDSAVILLKDINGNLNMNRAGTLDFNGHKINGNAYFAGSTYVVDSKLPTSTVSGITGAVTGNPIITAGVYSADVTAFLKPGYVIDSNAGVAAVRNGYYYIVANGDGYKLVLTPSVDVLEDSSKETLKAIAGEIAADLAHTFYVGGAAQANGNGLYSVNYNDLVDAIDNGLNNQQVNALIDSTLDYAGINALANEILDALCDFTAVGNAINNNTALTTVNVDVNLWDVEVRHVANGDYLTVDVAPSQESATKRFDIYVKNIHTLGDTLLALGEIATADAQVELTDVSYLNKQVNVTGRGEGSLYADLTENEDFAVAIGVILADGVNDAAKKAALIDAIETYYADGDLADLKAVFDTVTTAELIDAFSSTTAFNDRVTNTGLDGVVAQSVSDLYDVYENVIRAGVKAFDVTGFEGSSKTLGSLETENYGEYSGSVTNKVKSASEDRFAGQFTVDSAELTVKIFPEYKVLTNDGQGASQYKGDDLNDAFDAATDGSTVKLLDDLTLEDDQDVAFDINVVNADKIDFAGKFILTNVENSQLVADADLEENEDVTSGVANYEVFKSELAGDRYAYVLVPVKYDMTFDANGGTILGEATKTYKIAYLETYGSATGWTEIVEPVRPGYRFDGWVYANVFTLTSLDDQYGLQSDGTFVANWTKVYTLTFNANGGTIGGENSVSFPIAYMQSYADATGWTEIPTPEREGYKFEGWCYVPYNYYLNNMGEQYGVQTDAEFTAQWKEIDHYYLDTAPHAFSNNPQKVGSTFTAAGIASGGLKGYVVFTDNSEEQVVSRSNKRYFKYYLENGDELVDGTTVITADMLGTHTITVVSNDEPRCVGTVTLTFAKPYTLTFNANGGTIDGQATVSFGASYGETYRSITGWTDIHEPVRAGYRFGGWSYLGVYTMALDDGYGLQADGEFTAVWAPLYTITFDANGGTIHGNASEQFQIANGDTYAAATGYTSIPIPERDGYQFDGWYVAAYNYTLGSMDEVYSVNENATFVARWRGITEGFIIHVDWLDETVKDIIVLSNEPGVTYTDFESIKYRNGQEASTMLPYPHDETDQSYFWVRALPKHFMDAAHVDPDGNDHFFNFKVDHEGEYTVFIRFIDGSFDIYTETVTASGDANVTTNKQKVTVTLPDTNEYDLKVFIYAPGEGYRNRNQVKNAEGSVSVKYDRFVNDTYTFNVVQEGVYTYVAHFVDETWEIGTFTVTSSGNKTPTITSTQISNIGSNLDVIRYLAGDHSDMTMADAKQAGAAAVPRTAVVNKTYQFKQKMVGTYTFFLHFANTGIERVIVVDIADEADKKFVNSTNELVAALNTANDGDTIIVGYQIRPTAATNFNVTKNITINMNGKEIGDKNGDVTVTTFTVAEGKTLTLTGGGRIVGTVNGTVNNSGTTIG